MLASSQAAEVEEFGGSEALDRPRSLVGRCVSGEMTAWRELHRLYYTTVLAFLRKLGVRDSEVEDACQEVFLQAFKSLGQFRGDAELRTWLYRLCATQASRCHRKKKGNVRLLEGFAQSREIAEPATIGNPEAFEAQSLLERALGSMSERERLVFVLFELEGVSGEDAAQIAGCPVNTVWRRLHDARKKFRAVIEPAIVEQPS